MIKETGLTVNLLKDLLQQETDINSTCRNSTPCVIWSTYDRIDVKETNSFQEFFEYSFYPNNWIGDVQSLYLYPFFENDDNSNIHVSKDDLKKGLFYLDKDECPYLFFSFVTVKINEKIGINIDLKSDVGLIKAVLNRIYSLNPNTDIKIKAFRSMGAEDVIFLLLGNKVSEIIKIVYSLRTIKVKPDSGRPVYFCSTTYSIMGQNCVDEDCLNNFSDSEAHAQVLLTLKEGIRASQVKTNILNFSTNYSEMRIGEYDIQISSSANEKFLKQYIGQNILNASSPKYKKFFLNSKTIWYLDNAAIPKIGAEEQVVNYNFTASKRKKVDVEDTIFSLQANATKLKGKILRGDNKDSQETERNLDNNRFNAVYQDIILFINELIKIMCSCAHSEWTEYVKRIANAFNIGVEIFLKTLIGDETVVELEKASFEENILEINKVLSDLRNALSHIHKSGEHFYNVPHPSIYYSGSAHKVLLAYYNFVELVLSLGYLKPHRDGTEQSAISFFITFGMTNKVKTEIHFKSTVTAQNRLVSFQLPYAALYDFKKYFPAILHEVYHLIAPTDRYFRNQMLLCSWLYTQLLQYIPHYIEQFFDSKEDDGRAVYALKSDFSQLLAQTFLHNQSDTVLRKGINVISNYYLQNTGIKNSILDLDQTDFTQLLVNFFSDNGCSILVTECLRLFDDFLNDDKNATVIQDIVQEDNDRIDFLAQVNKIRKRINNSSKKSTYIVAEEKADFTNAEKYSAGLKEVICDLFLIYILKWNLSDYLKYMQTLFQENDIPWKDQTSQEFAARIGTIIAYFYKMQVSPDESTNNSVADKWLKQQIGDIMEKEDANELIKNFHIYVCSYNNQFTKFLPLLFMESIGSIRKQISDKADRKLFTEKEKKVRHIYKKLSTNLFSEQIEGVLNLQISEYSVPKNKKLKDSAWENTKNKISDCCPIGELASNRELGTFLQNIIDIKDMFENSDEELWYRGVCDASYGLYPSLYRKLPEISDTLCNKFTPYGYQAIMIKQAYMQTKTHYTLMEFNEQPLAARHSFLQHYGIPTNFLDFSTNPLAALYWALNPEASEDQDNVNDAAVYVFSPEKYQDAINIIQSEHIRLRKDDADYFYPYNSHNCLSDEYVIRQMSNEELLKKKKEAEKYQKKVKCAENYKYKRLPLATVVPQKNDRIMAQEGCFVAYNLLSAYDPSNQKYPFDYLTLQAIQNEYVRICHKNKKQIARFLYRIVIPIMYKQCLREELSAVFGYSLSKVYPDVDKLFEAANKAVDGYFKRRKNK